MSNEPAVLIDRGLESTVPPSLQEVERLVASLRKQVEQLFQQRDQLAQAVQHLESQLTAKQEVEKQLQAKCDKYKELARVYIEIANPLGDVIRDFETMPPLEKLQTADEVLAGLEALQDKLSGQKSA